SVFRDEDDHWFRDDRDQFDREPRNGDHDEPGMFSTGGVTLDITKGKLFLLFDLREIKRANEEIVYASDQRSPPPSLRARFGTTGDRPSLCDQSGCSP